VLCDHNTMSPVSRLLTHTVSVYASVPSRW
jgi:hypothetical protein